jgi:hypothetical protein
MQRLDWLTAAWSIWMTVLAGFLINGAFFGR